MTTTKETVHSKKDPTMHPLELLNDRIKEDGLEFCLCAQHSREDEMEVLSRPILVGYAFGPKKMSTMGVVMAEASKTHLSSVSTTVLVEKVEEDDTSEHDEVNEEQQELRLVCGNDEYEQESSSRDQQQLHPKQQHHCNDAKTCTGEGKVSAVSSTVKEKNLRSSPRRKTQESNNGNVLLSLDSYSGGLKNIVRYLHSSCSSVDTNSTTTTHLTTGTTLTGVTPSCGSTCGRLCAGTRRPQRLWVSFVPLDPNLPLEDQHGAKMDIILHKLTEDILCLSKFSPMCPDLVPSLGGTTGRLERNLEEIQPQLPCDEKGAIMRVHRLMQYKRKYPDCSLADDPAKVLTLMSRSDIAHALANCLVGVTSASGIPVASPKFIVWQPSTAESSIKKGKSDDTENIARHLRLAQMSYPLIAKPLQAAGTKISHHMTVLLHEASLARIQKSFCLLQEYANHDGRLYKVYVLGNNVHVYQRPSLPNLPLLFGKNAAQQQGPSYVDFDSQRPYPCLSAFGIDASHSGSKRVPPPYLSSFLPDSQPLSPCTTRTPDVAVTAEEVQPIVDTLKKAFGLELFGFDILITTPGSRKTKEEREMLVVDVNYFPSYKEVLNFPSLLAQYLTQRAVDSIRKPTANRADKDQLVE